MNSKALLSTSLLRRACMLGIVLSVAILTTNAEALPEPKVRIHYSLETIGGVDYCLDPTEPGAYWQDIYDTPVPSIGDVYYVEDVDESCAAGVDVLLDSPLLLAIEFTADSPGGNIVNGPVELTGTHFEREFEINSGGLTLVHTRISTRLSRKATGTFSDVDDTITWDNVVGENAYEEKVYLLSTCTGFGCGFVNDPFPRVQIGETSDVILPIFSVLTIDTLGDAFASDDKTPNDTSDDIPREDSADATVRDTWQGVAVPEPNREILLLAGALGLVGLSRLRERGSASA